MIVRGIQAFCNNTLYIFPCIMHSFVYNNFLLSKQICLKLLLYLVKMRSDCLFCWYWWNFLPSPFKHRGYANTELLIISVSLVNRFLYIITLDVSNIQFHFCFYFQNIYCQKISSLFVQALETGKFSDFFYIAR
jgi:hypothetical protein